MKFWILLATLSVSTGHLFAEKVGRHKDLDEQEISALAEGRAARTPKGKSYYIDDAGMLFERDPKFAKSYLVSSDKFKAVLPYKTQILALKADGKAYQVAGRKFHWLADGIQEFFAFDGNVFGVNASHEVSLYRGKPGELRSHSVGYVVNGVFQATSYTTQDSAFAPVGLKGFRSKLNATTVDLDTGEKIDLSRRGISLERLDESYAVTLNARPLGLRCRYESGREYQVGVIWVAKEAGKIQSTVQYQAVGSLRNYSSPKFEVTESKLWSILTELEDEKIGTEDLVRLFEDVIAPQSRDSWKIESMRIGE